MLKRLSIIILVSIILVSFLGMFFLHHGAKSHCPFCSRGIYQFAIISEIVGDLFASDSNFQIIPIENFHLLQSVVLESCPSRAPPA